MSFFRPKGEDGDKNAGDNNAGDKNAEGADAAVASNAAAAGDKNSGDKNAEGADAVVATNTDAAAAAPAVATPDGPEQQCECKHTHPRGVESGYRIRYMHIDVYVIWIYTYTLY